MTYILIHGHPAACVLRPDGMLTYCENKIDERGAYVVDREHHEVCAICRCAAEADGVKLPKKTGY